MGGSINSPIERLRSILNLQGREYVTIELGTSFLNELLIEIETRYRFTDESKNFIKCSDGLYIRKSTIAELSIESIGDHYAIVLCVEFSPAKRIYIESESKAHCMAVLNDLISEL